MGWLLAIKIAARRIKRHGSDNGCEKKLIGRVRLHQQSSLRFKSIAQRSSSIYKRTTRRASDCRLKAKPNRAK